MSELSYIDKLKNLKNPTFQKIREIADASISHLSNKQRNELYNNLKRGVKILETHEELCQYLWSFGNMHEKKIHYVVDKLPVELFQSEYDVVDWGCGQGIATICFFDYLKELNYPIKVDKVKLIEPGKIALDRAKLHVAQYIDENKIHTINKYFEEVGIEEIKTEGKPVIHFFSNILDIQEIDLKELAEKLGKSLTTDNYIVTVGPTNATNNRIDWFYEQYFKNKELIFEKEDRHFYNKWTLKAKVYKLEYNKEGNLIPIEFFPPVQFHSAYQLDIIKNSLKQASNEQKDKFKILTSFEIFAPFDIGANVYDDVHPIYAVLNNIVTRGLPTKASPYIEEVFKNTYNFTTKIFKYGEILFQSEKQINIGKYLEINSIEVSKLNDKEKVELELIFSPILIARIQKTIIEAVLTNKLKIKDRWKILVEEKDIPGTGIAIEDLKQLFNNLCALSKDFNNLKFPKIDLTIINKHFNNSALHLKNKVHTKSNNDILNQDYDLVLDTVFFEYSNNDKPSFSKYKALNKCYFNIRSSENIYTQRNVYTTDRINYRNLVKHNAQGGVEVLKAAPERLKYLLQLLFRKDDFRDGQLPILNRALQNKAVIGLLPTGGGKSLTYQLAAMLQPGVTVIVDPLKSLMKDQYDGLLNYGIDNCSYINSSLSKKEREEAEKNLEHSNLLFIFLSPERLAIYNFRERLKNMEQLNVYFSYGVIDEVHCVSEWGHDFRFSYLHLGRNLYNYVKPKTGYISLFGLTATASFDVLADVERELSGNGAFLLDSETVVRHENTNRLELQYKIEKINVEFQTDKYFDKNDYLDRSLPRAVRISDKWTFYNHKNDFLFNYIKQIPQYIRELQQDDNISRIKEQFIERINLQDDEEKQTINSSELKVEIPDDFYTKKSDYKQAGIVFCPHKNNTGLSVNENVRNLNQYIPDIGKFYGGDDNENFEPELIAFRDNKKPLMIATKAFGMGIDKPNVRFTVNMNYSSSLESFVQEAGRAGRDRKMALSVILISDYKLVRIKPKAPLFGVPFTEPGNNISIIKGKWFKPKDLENVLKHYNLDVDEEHLDYLTPEKDLVRITCNDGTNKKHFGFSKCNDMSCPVFASCVLKKLPEKAENWQYEKDLTEILKENSLYIPKKYFEYQNADYETVMYFYNDNFKGPVIEKQNMVEILNNKLIKAFIGNNVETKSTFDIKGFLGTLIDSNVKEEIVSFVRYIPDEIIKKIKDTLNEIIKKETNRNRNYKLPSKLKYNNSEYIINNKLDIVNLFNDIIKKLELNLNANTENVFTILNTSFLVHSASSIEKAIYRMTSIGLIEDFTQDYKNHQFRIVSTRHKEGDYFNKLQEYLERYYSKERAKQELEKAKNRVLPKETDNELRKEIYKCLAYLTDFVYDKISVKRKRAIDDMRNFCLIGIDESKEWKETNEILKDFIFYYFNSKYAQLDYVTEYGEGYSLTKDTEGGKISNSKILFKYMRVIEPEIVGTGTEIDNIKHLQGAVRLIMRSLTDSNPTISLLNAFCLMFLGTKDNENLEQQLESSYKNGMIEFYSRLNNKLLFIKEIFEKYNDIVLKHTTFPEKKLANFKKEILLNIHVNEFKKISTKYLEKWN